MHKFFRKAFKMLMLALVGAMIGVFGITLPTNPSVSSATVGKDYLLYVNTGTVGSPTWTLIGGQKSSDLNRTAESIDVSHKTTGGWKSNKAGLRGWSIDLSGLLLLQDDGIAALDAAFTAGVEINIKLEYPDGTVRTGWGSLTDFSETNADDGAAEIKGTIEGNGAISDRSPSVSPLLAEP
jgi:TP901-1 family phage major tail protein